jgi:hypothetical protein
MDYSSQPVVLNCSSVFKGLARGGGVSTASTIIPISLTRPWGGASWRWRYTKKLLSAAGGYLFNQIKTPKGRKQRRRRRVCCARVHTWVGLGLVPPLRALDERTDGRMHRSPPCFLPPAVPVASHFLDSLFFLSLSLLVVVVVFGRRETRAFRAQQGPDRLSIAIKCGVADKWLTLSTRPNVTVPPGSHQWFPPFFLSVCVCVCGKKMGSCTGNLILARHDHWRLY